VSIEAKCIECGHPFLVQFPDASPGLDVERLARAMEVLWRVKWETEPGKGTVTLFGAYAEDIAREYAALAADRETPNDFGSQVAMKGVLPKDLAERIDRIEGR